MECAPLVLPQFQPLLADANQMNYQNTVAVHNDDDSWWLGYIQDMDGDQAFIHFDAKKVADRWVHQERVWPLLSRNDYRWQPYSAYMRVHAALRDEDDGPFRYRPVRIINKLLGCEICEMYYIQTDTAATNGQPDNAPCEVVQNCQIIKQLPPAGFPVIQESSSGLLSTKYFAPFSRAQTIFNDTSDKFRIIMHFRQAFQSRLRFSGVSKCCDAHASGQFRIGQQFRQALESNSYNHFSDGFRFHLPIEQAGCAFLLMHLAMDAEMAQLVTATLTEVLETHLFSRGLFPSIRTRNLHVMELGLHTIDAETDVECTGVHLCHLPPILLREIFSHMDLHSQMRAKRVCALWQQLLSGLCLTQHISISLESCTAVHSDNNNCFRAASLLSRTINSTTNSLTVLGDFLPHNLSFLASVLGVMKIKLPLIVFKDHLITNFGYLGHLNPICLKHPITNVTTLYRNKCGSILLHNWKADHLFTELMRYVFKQAVYGPGSRCAMPLQEQAFMRDLTNRSLEWPIEQLRISIPRLLLSCGDDHMDMAGRVMRALSDNTPSVTADMLGKVTAVYARWVRTLGYPNDWQAIRSYLLL
ncbi:uncharacterized protein LOC129589974 isoform X2 [Paramacrobiotus metropolitanus]|nr:uncharacterized protein LOC129589974 isoform X2 [Paramacrobiotus metropolitanus]